MESHGTCGAFTDFRALDILPALAPWRKTAFQSGALPHFEELGAFADAFDALLADQPSASPYSTTGSNPATSLAPAPEIPHPALRQRENDRVSARGQTVLSQHGLLRLIGCRGWFSA